MPESSLEVGFTQDRRAVIQGSESPCVSVLLSLEATLGQPAPRPPVSVTVLLDCSGTVRRLLLDEEETRRWIDVARERSEIRRTETDQRAGYEFTGQTLAEARDAARCPLSLAASALQTCVEGLRENDVFCLVGFATRSATLYDGRRRLQRQPLQAILRAIEEKPSTPGLGDGTKLAEGAQLAVEFLKSDPTKKRVRRLILITDGIVEDEAESLQILEQIRREGIAISAIGVGQEFDEEYLARLADWTGGSYYYAANAKDLEDKLDEEFGTFRTVAARGVRVSARGLEGAVVNSITQIRPQMRMFEEICLRDDWFQVEVGDISGSTGARLIGEFALPWLSLGRHFIGELQLDWTDPATEEPQQQQQRLEIECVEPAAPPPTTNSEVEQALLQLEIYRKERAAQWAAEGGRAGLSTVRLREASQLLTRLGKKQMAAQFEEQAEEIKSGKTDSDQTKMIKDWVRRLDGGGD
ncbi:MAG: VWA domain-containing protein [Armatimonadetes bacterium]|nr:VWA domain-containing protein [Armatimonadota bacterium]